MYCHYCVLLVPTEKGVWYICPNHGLTRTKTSKCEWAVNGHCPVCA